MLTCRAAAERLSRSLDGSLPLLDRVALGAHLLMCSSCRQFRSQFLTLHKASSMALIGGGEPDAGLELSDDSKRRIALAMEGQA